MSKNSYQNELSLVFVTFPSNSNYSEWCKNIIERRLAACVNIVKVRSIYRWEGKIEESDEVLLIFKTTKEKANMLKETVLKEHPYRVPEFIEVSISDVNKSYIEWVMDSTSRD